MHHVTQPRNARGSMWQFMADPHTKFQLLATNITLALSATRHPDFSPCSILGSLDLLVNRTLLSAHRQNHAERRGMERWTG